MKRLDLTGQKFGELLVESRAASTPGGAVRWNCVCSCGGRSLVMTANLRHNKTTSCGCKRSRRGANSPFWKGDAVGYSGGHARVKRERGHPSKCESCGIGSSEARIEWASVTRNYADPNDYIGLCTGCHRAADGNSENVRTSWYAQSGSSGEARLSCQDNGNARLLDEEVLEIRRRREAGALQPALAAEFGVTQATISNIVLRKQWRTI
jgi:hypothetical protein